MAERELDEQLGYVPGQVSVSTALRLLKTFSGDPKTLHSFITNVENGFTILHERDHDTFIKFVVASIEGPAQITISDLPELTWEAIKDKLTTHYSDKRTLEFYANNLFTSKQKPHETVGQWGTRVELMTTDVVKAFSSMVTGWSTERRGGGLKVLAEFGKACFIRGIQNPDIQIMIRARGGADNEIKQLIQLAVDEESTLKSREKTKYFERRSQNKSKGYVPMTQGGGPSGNRSTSMFKREPQVNVVQIKCYRCQMEGHIAKECRNKPQCGKCHKKGHTTRECQGNGR